MIQQDKERTSPEPQEPHSSRNEGAVRLSPHYLNLIGFQHHLSHLKMGDYKLIFVPYELSPRKGRFLLSLSAQEVDFFNRRREGLCKLNIGLIDPETEKVVTTYVLGSCGVFKPLNDTAQTCLVSFSFKSRSATYDNVFRELARQDQYLRELYNDIYYQQMAYSKRMIDLMLTSPVIDICEKGKATARLSVETLGIKELTAIGELPSRLAVPGTAVRVKIRLKRKVLILRTSLREYTARDGRKVALFDLAFDPLLVSEIANYTGHCESSVPVLSEA